MFKRHALSKKQKAMTPTSIDMAVATQDGKVRLAFSRPVQWIDMDPDKADGIAEGLRKAAAYLREQPPS